MLLSVLVGTGAQILTMAFCTLALSVCGFLSYANRGGLLTALLLLFVFMGSLAGYCAARLYKFFGGKHWKQNTILTAMLYPGVVFAVFFAINAMLYLVVASSAVPFSALLALLVLWFGVSAPLVLLGSYLGFK